MLGWRPARFEDPLERPGDLSRSREGPLRSRMGVTLKITVTIFCPRMGWRHIAFIHTNDTHVVTLSWIVDQQTLAFTQDKAVDGVLGTCLGAWGCAPPSHDERLAQSAQRPPLGARLVRLARIWRHAWRAPGTGSGARKTNQDSPCLAVT